jgi:hypothetical protein
VLLALPEPRKEFEEKRQMENTEPVTEKKAPVRRAGKLPQGTSPAKRRKAGNRRPKPLPGLARKLGELATQVVETALKEEARNGGDHTRVRALFDVVLSGAVTTLLKNSTLLTEDDRAFLRDLGYLPKPTKETV